MCRRHSATCSTVRKASRIEKSLKEGKERFFITDVTISEVVWVLHSFYNLSKSEIINKVEGLLNLTSIELDRDVISKALEFFRIYNIDDVYPNKLWINGEGNLAELKNVKAKSVAQYMQKK